MRTSKRDYRAYNPTSAYHVFYHALWRVKRGKRPSMPYAGIRDPSAALTVANMIVERNIRLDRECAQGMLLCYEGKTFGDVEFDDQIAMLRWVTEDCADTSEVRKRIIGILEIPPQVVVRIYHVSRSEFKDEFCRNCWDDLKDPRQREFAVRLANGITTENFSEMYRAWGGMVLKNGDPVAIDLFSLDRKLISV